LNLGLRFGQLLLEGLAGVICRLGLNGLFLHVVELGMAGPHFKLAYVITT